MERIKHHPDRAFQLMSLLSEVPCIYKVMLNIKNNIKKNWCLQDPWALGRTSSCPLCAKAGPADISLFVLICKLPKRDVRKLKQKLNQNATWLEQEKQKKNSMLCIKISQGFLN